MIHIRAEEEAVQDWLSPLLRGLQERSEITAHIFPVPELQPRQGQGTVRRYALRIRGQDRSGIVYKTSSFLAGKGINILDMDTRLEQEHQDQDPVFRMYTLIEVPEEADNQAFRSELESLASDLQESVSLSKATGKR
jgi:glycine cleavage system regulatory protein